MFARNVGTVHPPLLCDGMAGRNRPRVNASWFPLMKNWRAVLLLVEEAVGA
jgi:hypothetical protein